MRPVRNGPSRRRPSTACWRRWDRIAILAADRYLEIRRNLVRLFEWRGCSTPDEYADETINRCAKKIGEGEEIRDLATYCVGVARMLLREMRRERAREARLFGRSAGAAGRASRTEAAIRNAA